MYDPQGYRQGTVSAPRLAWLRTCYARAARDTPDLHARLTHGSFERDVAQLLARYRYKRGAPLASRCANDHWMLTDAAMQVFAACFGADTQRFVSPLDVSTHCRSYYTAHPQDQLFGARHNAYSTWWTGASFVHPPFESTSLFKALRWAVSSALHSPEPCCTLILVPEWSKSAHSVLLDHEFVFHLDRFPKTDTTVPLQQPCHTRGHPEIDCAAAS